MISAQKEGFGNEFAWRKEQDLFSLGSVGVGGDFSCFFSFPLLKVEGMKLLLKAYGVHEY